MKLRLATESAQVLGIVIDVNRCWVVATGLDGELREERMHRVETLGNYKDLIDALVKHARALMARPGVRTLGVGVTVPGLIDHRRGLDILSPNVHVIDGRSPGRDLGERLGLECVMIQDQHALCMAERHFGRARGLDDFAILDVSSGVGMGVMSGGRLVRGHSGFAGEIGHITVVARRPSLRLRQPRLPGNRRQRHRAGLAGLPPARAAKSTSTSSSASSARASSIRKRTARRSSDYLAIGLATVINIFNPSTLFIHGQLFDVDEGLFARVLEETRKRALAPSFADCRIIRAEGSKRQGAVASIIQHLIDSVCPNGYP